VIAEEPKDINLPGGRKALLKKVYFLLNICHNYIIDLEVDFINFQTLAEKAGSENL